MPPAAPSVSASNCRTPTMRSRPDSNARSGSPGSAEEGEVISDVDPAAASGRGSSPAGTTAPSTVINTTVLPSPASLPGNVTFGSNTVLPYGNDAGVVGGVQVSRPRIQVPGLQVSRRVLP